MIAELRSVGLLLSSSVVAILLAYQLPGPLFVDFGPNDTRYARGFREDFEIDEPTLFRWTTNRSRVELPFHLRGPYDVTLRFKRHIDAPAEIRLFLSGESAAAFVVPQQNFTVRSFHARNEGGGRFEMRVLSRSEDERALGLAVDWMEVRPARRLGAILPNAAAMAALLSWILAFYFVPRLLGLSRGMSLGSGFAATAAVVALAAIHKFWPVQAALTIGFRGHVVGLALLLLYRLRARVKSSSFALPEARWAVFVVYLGLAVRLFALFHPDFYYPDVRTHSKFVSIIWTEGLDGFFSDHIENQHRHLLGLQLVGDRWVAFPYPPLLYLTVYPLSLLQLPVEDWMKLLPATLAALEALLVFALAVGLGASARVALAATLLHATARVLAFRLAVASYAALFGHFWDMVSVLYLVCFFDRIAKPRYYAGFGVLVALSLLSYAGSGLVLGLFVPALCVALWWTSPEDLEEKVRRRAIVLAVSALAGALVAVGSFYWQYLPELFPAAPHGTTGTGAAAMGGLVEWSFTPLAAVVAAIYRWRLFYGIVFVAVALVPLLTRWARAASPLARSLVIGSIASYAGLNFLRAGLGGTHIFQFSKDDLVILPVMVVAVGVVIERAFRRPRTKLLAVGLVAGWIGWGLVSLAGDVRSRFIRPDYPPLETTAPGLAEQLPEPVPGLYPPHDGAGAGSAFSQPRLRTD